MYDSINDNADQNTIFFNLITTQEVNILKTVCKFIQDCSIT